MHGFKDGVPDKKIMYLYHPGKKYKEINYNSEAVSLK